MTQLLERPDIATEDRVRTLSPTTEYPKRQRDPWHIWFFAVAMVAAIAAWTVPLLLAEEVDDHLLVTVGDSTVALLDPAIEDPVYEIEDAIAAPDGSTIYRTTPQGNDTEVDQIDTGTGAVINSQVVEGPRHIRVVPPEGGAVALMSDKASRKGIYRPVARETTSITVAWNDGPIPRTYDLDGNFEPEAFSRDEDTLFLIEFWPALEPDRYFVRHLDLTTGDIVDKYSPEVELQPEMRGKARAQVLAPDLQYLYTLDSGADPVHDPDVGVDSERWAFIHVLDLNEEASICIFLPEPFGTGDEAAVSLGISPDGSRLFVVDASTQHVATIDAEEMVVLDVGTIDMLRPGEQVARPAIAVVDEDKFFVTTGGWTILEIDAGDQMTPIDAFSAGRPVRGLNLSPDQTQLRIALPSQVVVFDLELREQVVTITVPRGDDITFVGARRGTVERVSLECAC